MVKDLHKLHLQHFVAYAPSIKPGTLRPNDKDRSRHSINDQQTAVCVETPPARGPHESAINSIPPAGASAPPNDLPLMPRTETRLMDVSEWSPLDLTLHPAKKDVYSHLPYNVRSKLQCPAPIPLSLDVLSLNVEVLFCQMLPEFQKSTA